MAVAMCNIERQTYNGSDDMIAIQSQPFVGKGSPKRSGKVDVDLECGGRLPPLSSEASTVATLNDLNDASASPSPPTSWVMISDWCNVFGGIFLELSFIVGGFMIFGESPPNFDHLTMMSWFFVIEGVFYAIGAFFMIGIKANTPPAHGGGAGKCMQFAVLMLGGVFFAFSGLTNPACITRLGEVFSKETCIIAGAQYGPYAWNAMAHLGQSCFMVASAYGFSHVLSLPKDRFFSHFWCVTMYFMGAWTIGIFKIWGPVLTGFAASDPFAATPWYVACLGAGFLTTGAVIQLKSDLDKIRE